LSSKNSNLIHLKKIESSFMGNVSNWKTLVKENFCLWPEFLRTDWVSSYWAYFPLNYALWHIFYIPFTIIYIHHTPRLSLSLTHILLKFKFFSYHFTHNFFLLYLLHTFFRDKHFFSWNIIIFYKSCNFFCFERN
jgi:hypothetical protein